MVICCADATRRRYVDKYMSMGDAGGPPHMGTGATLQHKTMPPDELEAMVQRCVHRIA